MKSTKTSALAMLLALGLVASVSATAPGVASCGDTGADPSTTPPVVRPWAL